MMKEDQGKNRVMKHNLVKQNYMCTDIMKYYYEGRTGWWTKSNETSGICQIMWIACEKNIIEQIKWNDKMFWCDLIEKYFYSELVMSTAEANW